MSSHSNTDSDIHTNGGTTRSHIRTAAICTMEHMDQLMTWV